MARRENLTKPKRTILLKKIRMKLKSLRLEKGLTQNEMAEITHLHPKYIARWEGTDLNPSISTIADCVNGLGLTLEEFFGDIQPKPTHKRS